MRILVVVSTHACLYISLLVTVTVFHFLTPSGKSRKSSGEIILTPLALPFAIQALPFIPAKATTETRVSDGLPCPPERVAKLPVQCSLCADAGRNTNWLCKEPIPVKDGGQLVCALWPTEVPVSVLKCVEPTAKKPGIHFMPLQFAMVENHIIPRQ